MAEYVVVMGADADAWFLPEDGPMQVLAVRSPVGPFDITLQTRFVDEGHTASVPREMWVEARGSAETDLKAAINAYANASAGLLPIIAFAANAYVDDLELKIAYDATETSTQRAFFQSFVREEGGTVPRPGRWVDIASTLAFMTDILTHEQSVRLRRATAQYALALAHWRFGHETLAVAHLYIASEALTPVARQRECDRLGIEREDLAESWAVDVRGLDAEVRRRLLFQGDDDTYAAAKQASDGFEHGFLDFDDVRLLSRHVRDTTARYVRTAVVDLAGVAGETRAKLLDPPRDKPLRSFLTRYLWGEFVGKAPDLALPEEHYPRFLWKSRLKEITRDGKKMLVTPEETTTARFSSAVTFQPARFEVWGPDGLERREPGTIEAKIIRGDSGEVEEVPLKSGEQDSAEGG